MINLYNSIAIFIVNKNDQAIPTMVVNMTSKHDQLIQNYGHYHA